MNMGIEQIMWKEIGAGLLVIYLVRCTFDLYMVYKYKCIINQYKKSASSIWKLKAIKHLKLCNVFAVGPWNKHIYKVYNGLCWFLASVAYDEGKENDFLKYLDCVKNEKEFEMKPFVLALYYRSKEKNNLANEYYDKFWACEHEDSNKATVLKGIFEGDRENPAFFKAIEFFGNATITRLIEKNILF